jgi:hypothetical protein
MTGAHAMQQHTNRCRLDSLTSAVALALIATASASAAIVATDPGAIQIAPPASAQFGALAGPPIYCWDEQQNVAVPPSGIPVNTLGSGVWTGPGVNNATYFGVGVDSHMIHFDATSGVSNANAGVTFSSSIVAVIYENNLLAATDGFLGSPTTTYEPATFLRSSGAALFQNWFQVTGNHIKFSLWASTPGLPNRMMQLRVLTESAIPAPGALALLGAAGAIGARRRR